MAINEPMPSIKPGAAGRGSGKFVAGAAFAS